MRKSLLNLSIVMMTVMLLSCTPEKGGGDEAPALTGQSIAVPNEAGAVVTITLDMESDWNVASTSDDWFYVSPLSGSAGEVTLNINVQDTNPDHVERVSSFIIEAGERTEYFVIQDVTPGIDVPSDAMISMDGGEYTFSLKGNVKYEAVPDQDWIVVNGIEYDSTKLSDGSTYSKYMTSRIKMTVEANEGNVREGTVVLKGVDGVTDALVEVTQMGQLEADYDAEFLRRSVAIRFTATWCGNCPRMNVGLTDAIAQDPRHIIPLTMHVWDSDGGLNYDPGDDYADYFGIDGLPSGFMNNYAEIGGTYASAIVQRLVNDLAVEAVEELPANTAVAGSARIEDGDIVLDLGIASKEAGSYLVSVFVLEDGIVYEQLGGSSEYVHNAVARAEMTPMWGEQVSLGTEGLFEKTYSMPVPQSVLDENNLHLLVMVNEKGTFTGDVQYAVYYDWGYVIDNAVDIPVNGFSVFEYE